MDVERERAPAEARPRSGPGVPPRSVPRTGWRRAGTVLVALGLLTIAAAVIWVLEVANGPGTGPKTFARRRSYDQVKESVHEAFPLAFGVAMLGLAACALGVRLRRARAQEGA